MTVYSINQRVFEQASQSASSGKTSASAADQFLAALNQASAQISVGTSTVPSAEQALKTVFDRQVDETQPAEKVVEKPRRNNESKVSEAKDSAAESRDTTTSDTTETTARSSDDRAESDIADDEPRVAARDDDNAAEDEVAPVASAADDAAPTAEVIAVPVQVEQQITQTVVASAENNSTQVAEAVEPENIAEAADPVQQAQAASQGDEAAAATGEGESFAQAVATAAQQGAKTGAKTVDTDAAKAQAEDLAASLDDTGAQLNVQVKVSEAVKPVQPTVGTAEVLLTQDVSGLDLSLSAQTGDGQTNGQGQGNTAGQTAQAATPGMDPAAMNRPVDAKPFVAALAAAQTEAASQPQAATSGSGGQQTQAVAGLGGTSATQAANKTAQAQTAQAARQQQLPQAKEVMDQVKVQIAKQGATGDTIKVQLKPVELGSIEVKLDVGKDGSVSGVVTADNKDTLAMLKNDSRTLEKALSDAGFKTDPGSLSFNLRGESQQQSGNEQTFSRRSRRAGIAAADGVDATQSGLAAQAQARFAGARSGVDIQV